MSAQAVLKSPEESATANNFFSLSYNVQPTKRFFPDIELANRESANESDTDIDTSSVQSKLPSTFTRLLPDTRIAPDELLAEWDGYVTSIQEEGMFFSAVLNGLKGLGVKGAEEDAVIPISDVADWDKDLLREGNFFRLCVKQGVSPSGQPIRYTMVIFRRMPAYRQQDLDQAIVRGRELARSLRVE
ncbi:MAG: hypothetical protein HO274_00450 [Ferrovum myxofaciens]|uniref:hypothetical protein n=1 Tax=Ferrovum myxofaciens TaxID=416213 RepID=UPI002356F0D8|nr:hypothetical protein [Ferrovum myxofaciens]QKE39970.1 MAG: hypothetical protein HO274_00450 [Ferrovum myxofaciens]